MQRLLLRIALLSMIILIIGLLAHCSVSDNRPGEQAQIPESSRTITFQGEDWSDVVFNHTQHANRYDGMCIKCHDHEPIAGTTHWYCRSCHTAGQDRENLCNPLQYHGCVMTQCHNCHEVKGANPGLKCMDCHKEGPNLSPGTPGGPPITVFTDSVVSNSEVDRWTLTLNTSGTLVIDVQAWESCGNKSIPTDFFGDGDNNNKLVANIYLFNQNGTLVGSSTGRYPGDTAPGAHTTRSGQNPYLSISVSAGTYVLTIGSYPLSQADAWAGVNTDGSQWTDSFNGTTSYNKYNINIYFN